MFNLRFDENKCLACETHDCLTRCQYMAMDIPTAKAEMEKLIQGRESRVLHDCVTCYACEEYCPLGNHPFYLIVTRQEELDILPLPSPLIKRGVQMAIPFRGEPEIEPIAGRALNMGVFSMLVPHVQGRLFEDVTLMSTDSRKMFHYFCQLMYLHFGRTSVINERLEESIATIAAHGAREVIHFHDECYGTYASYAPAFGIDVPFKSVHLFEYLYERLGAMQDDIKPLNYKVAYQRPCSSRLSPDKHPFVDKLFDLIGVEHVQREFVDENALCCGSTIMGQRREGSRRFCLELQQKNIDDMKKAGAQLCVFNCPACMQTLGKPVADAGIMPIFMSDLCRLAIGEKSP
ncbi:(Fe-S)-binding protein [Desulfatitalea alkaliphila]|uniref:(Fe-S)-binding protein n=1 Tax=Desulfatitalea alkaliphila TaxID=2929485 RepID=A0AA41UQZ1_9BACT|nr:(Fe-S)-binding protein [Desulfatitalea alkaliphila]MCJ8501838.1 (Fe-S)-binding protein [Desulfatitalea alkaliphila]